MPRKSYARKTTRKYGTRKRYTRTYKRSIARVNRRINALQRRVAGEVEKFETTPDSFTNTLLTYGAISGSLQSNITPTFNNKPLNTISSGVPWVMPLNWVYVSAYQTGSSPITTGIYTGSDKWTVSGPASVSMRNPVWYNVLSGNQESPDNATELQYRLKYIYINALFNASINSSVNNTDGALRIVIVKDKQPTGGAATWSGQARGVFNANRIDAQLNPSTVGRFKIMYDKTLRFNTINGYKPFKYYKLLSTTIRNNRGIYSTGTSNNTLTAAYNRLEVNDNPPPVQKNAFYLMMFSDGLTFNYSADSSTPAASFHLFNRIAYYNN